MLLKIDSVFVLNVNHLNQKCLNDFDNYHPNVFVREWLNLELQNGLAVNYLRKNSKEEGLEGLLPTEELIMNNKKKCVEISDNLYRCIFSI